MTLRREVVLLAGAAVAAASGIALCIWSIWRRRKLDVESIKRALALLDQPSIYVRDPAALYEKLKSIKNGGPSNLQVISDFDMTLTKYDVDGKPGVSSYEACLSFDLLTEDCHKESQELSAKFKPIEYDSSISLEQKMPKMIEWWTKANQLFVIHKCRREWISAMAMHPRLELRDGVDDLFHLFQELKVPTLILSAGIGDVIQEVLQQQSRPYQHCEIEANFFKYNNEGVVVGMKGDLIHSFNKSSMSQIKKTHFEKQRTRTNVILFGDNYSDAVMSDGISYAKTILKIGYLNSNVESNLEVYRQIYDVVIHDQSRTNIVNILLRELLR